MVNKTILTFLIFLKKFLKFIKSDNKVFEKIINKKLKPALNESAEDLDEIIEKYIPKTVLLIFKELFEYNQALNKFLSRKTKKRVDTLCDFLIKLYNDNF